MSKSPASPMMELIEMANAYMKSQVLYAIAKHKIADVLAAGTKSAAEIAASTGMNEDAVFRTLRGLAAMGIFEESGGGFANNEISSFLVSDHPSNARVAILGTAAPVRYQLWANFEDTLRTGEASGLRTFGVSSWTDLFPLFPDWAADFGTLMSFMSRISVPPILEGSFVLAVADKFPKVQEAINYDLAQVIENNKHLSRGTVPPAFAEHAGDFFATPSNIPAGRDLYMMKSVLHDWTDELSVKILCNVASVMRRDSKLAVVEAVVSSGAGATFAKLADIHMMHSNGGRERTEAEWEVLAQKAGLRVVRFIHSRGINSVIEMSFAQGA